MSKQMVVFQDSGASEMELAPEFHALANTDMGSDLSGGVGGNYAIVSMRGAKWRIKHQGNEVLVTDTNGEPRPSLEAVIIKSNKHLTKQFYENGYQEGDSSPPTCFSVDGKVPSSQVEKPIHSSCALCPKNAFGSRIANRDDGTVSKAKACADNRKLAIVPLHDLHNEAFGGPMLFRVPASALKDLAQFGQLMQSRGFPYNAVAVRIGFDTEVSHPKPTFRAIRPLKSDEAAIIMELMNSDLTERVLADYNADAAPREPVVPAADEDFEEPQTAAAPAPPPPAVVKVAQPKPALKAVPTAPAPAPKPAVKAPVAATKVPAPPPAKRVAAAPAPAPKEPEVVDAEIVETPAVEETTAAQPSGIDAEIEDILAGLNAVS